MDVSIVLKNLFITVEKTFQIIVHNIYKQKQKVIKSKKVYFINNSIILKIKKL